MSNQTIPSSIGKLRSVKQIKSSLKPRAPVAKGNLTLQLGKARVKIPAEVRVIHKNGMMFVHIPTYSELMVDGKVVNEDITANEAAKELMPKVSRAPQDIEMPADLAAALNKLPNDYKLVIKEGAYKVIKGRQKVAVAKSPNQQSTPHSGEKVDWESVIKEALANGPKTVREIVKSMPVPDSKSSRDAITKTCKRLPYVHVQGVVDQAYVYAMT